MPWDCELYALLGDHGFHRKVSKEIYWWHWLGLFISKNIIEKHGGKILAENNNNCDGGRGATFAFNLPIN